MSESERFDRSVVMICKFLHDNHALERFCNNHANYHHITSQLPTNPGKRSKYIISHGLKSLMMQGYKCDLLTLSDFIINATSAFSWGLSVEGDNFWMKLHTKWRRAIAEAAKKYELIA